METSSSTAPTRRHVVHDDDLRKRGSSKPTTYGIRKSCELCRRRKKKCDGGRPCHRCLGAGVKCAYIMRRWHQPPQQRQQQQQQQQPSEPAQQAQGTLSLKRCRLSASPATGLVGMRENVFLSDFFSCVGFLPLTTPSYIREAMVKLMAAPAVFPASHHGAPGGGYSDITVTEDTCRSDLGATESSVCTFWCAVALGALARGSPIESVSRYCQLARGGLASPSGPVNAERATAWAILAYLYLFCGNTDLFQEYLALSASFLNEAVEKGSSDGLPVGFAEIVDHRMTVKICCGEVDTDEVESFCAQVEAPPELSDAANQSELYSFVMRSYRMFERAVYGTAYSRSGSETCGGEGGLLGGVELDHEEGRQANPRLTEPSDEVLNAMIVQIKRQRCQVERLEDAADRPSIRSGIGGMIINGNLFFDKLAKGDLSGSFERIGRCVEVFQRFPGLCRLTMGAHAAHILTTALTTMDGCEARELYHTLRTAYNSARLPGTAPVPPLEEWQGISPCCDYFYCRTMERLLLSNEMGVSSSRADGGIPSQEGITRKDNGSFGLDRPTSGLAPTTIIPEVGRNPPAALSNSCPNGNELGSPCVRQVDPGSPPPFRGAPLIHFAPSLRERPALPPQPPSPPCPFTPNGESQVGLNADNAVAHDSGAKGGGADAIRAAQALGALFQSPGTSQWGGVEDGTTESGYRLAAEDWLEAADALAV